MKHPEALARLIEALHALPGIGPKSAQRLAFRLLQDDWALSRLDSTVRAILRAGTFEMLERKDVPVPVIVTEYVEIAKAFFEDDEPKLVNAVLDRIAKQVRGEPRK